MSVERRYALLGHTHDTFADTVTFSGIVNFDGAVDFDAAAVFDSTVDINGVLTVDGAASFSADVTFDTSGGDLHFLDSVFAFWGTGDDLKIYHDGTSNFIDAINGALILRAMGTGNHCHIAGNDSIAWFDFHAAAATELIVGDGTNSTSTRVTLDGPVSNRELRFETNGSLRWDIRAENTAEAGSNAGSLLEILARQDDGTASYTLLSATRATAQVGLVGGVGSTTSPNWAFVADLNTGVMRPGADQISLVAGGTETVAVTSSAVTITGDLTVTGDFTGTGAIDGEQSEVLASDVSISTDTVFDDIGALVFSSLATGQYIFEAYLDLSVNAVPDMKRRFHFTGTAADVLITSQTQGPAAATTLLTAFDTQQDLTTTGQFGCNYTGKFTITATGSLSFQAAQITSSATAISVNKGSWMRIRKMA